MAWAMRERLRPSQLLEHVKVLRLGHSDERRQTDMVLASYDALIIGGFVTRSDVYLSVPKSEREQIEALSARRGQSWSPGRRSGLHAAVRLAFPSMPDINLEVCLRYGPLESLYGDLYSSLRSYELLLWDFLVGVFSNEYGEIAADWRDTGWWRLTVNSGERKSLTERWGERPNVQYPWQLATFGTMVKMMENGSSRKALAAAEGSHDIRDFQGEVERVAHIRNNVMHPMARRNPTIDDFEFVNEALRNLAGRAQTALERGKLHARQLPSAADLLLPELLRERIYGEVEVKETVSEQA